MAARTAMNGTFTPAKERPSRTGERLRFVFLAAVGFDSCLSGRSRRLAEALAALGHRVAFVELPGVRASLTRLAGLGPGAADTAGVRVVRLLALPWSTRLGGRG